MKRITALLICAVMAFSMAACGGTPQATSTTSDETASAPTTTPVDTSTPTVDVGTTPAETETLTPTPTATPERDPNAGMTEEEMGVFPVGKYQIALVSGEGNLNYSEGQTPITVSKDGTNNLFSIFYQTTGDTPGYILNPGDDGYFIIGNGEQSRIKSGDQVISVDRKNLTYQSTSSGKYRMTQDSHCTTRWYFEPNKDGSYKMVLRTTTKLADKHDKYYVCYENGGLYLYPESNNKSSDFNITMVERGTPQFTQYISHDGKITLRLPPTAKNRAFLTDSRGQKWANDVEKCYYAFIELTNYVPYENIIVKAFMNCDYMAYVTSNYNTITVSYSMNENAFGKSNQWYIQDIKELVYRGEEAQDVNFCILHEMGHMFDIGTDWYFETEMMTDFKLTYCLDVTGFSAIPSEFSALDVFTYDNIEKCYLSLGKDVSQTKEYTYYGAAYRMVLIQKEIGSWEPYKQTYRWFVENRAKKDTGDASYVAIPTTKWEKMELFFKKLSEFSGKDVVSMFPEGEFDVWKEYMGYKG